MEKAKINKDIYGETGVRTSAKMVSVKVRNSGNKRPILCKGFTVNIMPRSSSFEGGIEYFKVITGDGRMFRIKKEDVDIL